MTTAFELGPDDQLPDGALIVPWPGLRVGERVLVEQGNRRRTARIRTVRPRYAIADPEGGDAA